ncbi:hypothetical protein C1I95_12495 [Micromonospora craterilacus]|uniref:Uncharacterized protein n=1 Tax=Micromonospora craterilacus TaxID=1655439 RepID=A0A2W2EZI3_9ACTN|nr:hypothetical protein [Micromonospora craterilacus]PZG18990.1 hypothetical protein C1I95_12495 [Micromonospora craterilacus]
MSLSDRWAAYVRTYWPLLIGHLTAAVVAYVATRFGILIDSIVVYEILAVAMTGGLYAVGRWLEARTGDGWLPAAARTIARWLLSLGIDTGQPTYGLPPADVDTKYLTPPSR